MRKLLAIAVLLGCTPAEGVSRSRQQEAPVVEPPAKVEPEAALEAAPAAEAAPTSPCLATFEIDSNHSVLDEQRRRGGAKRWDDFATRYGAKYLDPDADLPVETVESFRIGETPLLWFTPDFAEAVVNAAVLTELKVVDAPRLEVDERVEIGALTELGQGKIGGRALTQFLIEAGVIQTYWHIGATVCLVSEGQGGASEAKAGAGAETGASAGAGERSYRARFSAEHEYFTNEEHHDAYGFSVELDGEGRIFITGAKPSP